MDWTTYDFQTPLAERIQKTPTLPEAFRKQMADVSTWTKIALWELFDASPEEQTYIKNIIEPLYQQKEFFDSLRPYPGMVDFIHSLEDDYIVSFCTKPSKAAQCESEAAKRKAVIRDFGKKYSEKIDQTFDKTRTMGDILVDDNPYITWAVQPVRKQMLVDQPHNRDVAIPRLYVDSIATRQQQIDEVLRAK